MHIAGCHTRSSRFVQTSQQFTPQEESNAPGESITLSIRPSRNDSTESCCVDPNPMRGFASQCCGRTVHCAKHTALRCFGKEHRYRRSVEDDRGEHLAEPAQPYRYGCAGERSV